MTRRVRTAVLTGIAALAVAGVSLAAVRDTHMVKVDMPDGSVARIEYSGDIAPKVTFAPVSHTAPVALVGGFDSTPFAALDDVAVEMDWQAASIFHQAAQLQALPMLVEDKLETVARGKLPPGTVHYEFVSTSSGNGTCMRSVEMTSYPPGQAPRIVSTSSGDCRPLDRIPAPVRLDAPGHRPIPGLTKPRLVDNVDRGQVGTVV
jgi:hypothetical protein